MNKATVGHVPTTGVSNAAHASSSARFAYIVLNAAGNRLRVTFRDPRARKL